MVIVHNMCYNDANACMQHETTGVIALMIVCLRLYKTTSIRVVVLRPNKK